MNFKNKGNEKCKQGINLALLWILLSLLVGTYVQYMHCC